MSRGADALSHEHLRQIFAVLEAVHDVPPGSEYKEALTASLAEVLGVRSATFFFGPSFEEMFLDPSPTLEGIPDRLMRNYRDRWHDKDVFGLPTARRALEERGFVAITEIPQMPPPQQEYLHGQLVPNGLGSAAALRLRFTDGEAILGLFDSERVWTPPDITAMQSLARHLQARAQEMAMQRPPDHLDLDRLLSPRLREVAVLVGQGLTKAAIAERMGVTEQAVKKYMSRIFEATGLENRAMLAVAALRLR